MDDPAILGSDLQMLNPHIARGEFYMEIRNPKTNEFMFGLRYDGTTKFGESVEPDEACRVFWDAMGSESVIRRWAKDHGYKLVRE